MDDFTRKLNTRIHINKTELNELFTKIHKLDEEIATLRHKKINLQKTGNSGDVINRHPRSGL